MKTDLRTFTLDEQKRFLNVLEGERLGAAFKLSLASGLKLGELLALRWKDVDFVEGTIFIYQSLSRVRTLYKDSNIFESPTDNKSNATELMFQEPNSKNGKRVIPLPERILEDIIEHKRLQLKEKLSTGANYENNGLVFCTELGQPIDPRNFLRKFHQLIEKADIQEANFYTLRRTFAVRALENGMPFNTIQEILGVSSTGMVSKIHSQTMMDIKKSSMAKMDYLYKNSIENPPSHAIISPITNRKLSKTIKGKGLDMDL